MQTMGRLNGTVQTMIRLYGNKLVMVCTDHKDNQSTEGADVSIGREGILATRNTALFKYRRLPGYRTSKTMPLCNVRCQFLISSKNVDSVLTVKNISILEKLVIVTFLV